MIILGVALKDGFRVDLLAREIRNIAKGVIREAAEKWHSDILERHFQANSRQIYHYESRRRFYEQVIKKEEGVGKGKSAFLVLSGASERAALFMFRIISTQKRSTVRMFLPNYFVNPFVGTLTTQDGKTRTIRRQPNKVDELTRTTQGDRETLRRSARDRFLQDLRAKRAAKRTVLIAA